MRMFLLTICLSLILCGCATDNLLPTLTPSERAAISKIKVYKKNPVSKFRFRGVIHQEACRETEAMTGLKLQAVHLYANTIVDLVCRKRAKSKFSECKNATECSGTAITIK